MGNKNQIISKIMFFTSLAMFLIFAGTLFFGGQKIAGSIYFIFFAMSVAFACIDKKYHSNYFEFYRYAIYLDDIMNILAVSSIIYFKQDVAFMIAVLALVGVGLFVDLLAKNRFDKREIKSIIVSVLNCALMITIFPYFFKEIMPIYVPIIATVVAVVVASLKIVLALVPASKNKNEVEEESVSTIEKHMTNAGSNENNVE